MASSVLRAGSAALRTIRVGGVPEHFNTPWHTATAKGLFEAAGIAMEWTDFPGGTGAMTKALRAGELDVAIALTEGLVADLHRGNPSRLLGTYVSSPLTWGVHVLAGNEELQCMDDISRTGAKYAVSRMGSGSHLMACVDAHARGLDPASLSYEIVGDLEGARRALRDRRAGVFMWEKYTTKHLVDAGEWRRIGEVPTPWPCFSVAATNTALKTSAPELLRMLEVVRAEAAALRRSDTRALTIGVMYGQQEADVEEWLRGVTWSCQPIVSHQTLAQVMGALVDAGVLTRGELLEPSALLSDLSRDGQP